MTAPVDAIAKTTTVVVKQDEVEAPAELEAEPPVLTEPIEPASSLIEKAITTPAQAETGEQTETVLTTSSGSLFDPAQDGQDEDLFGRPAAPADTEDGLFGAEVSETDDFAGILGASVREGGDLETRSSDEVIAQPIKAEQSQEVGTGTASVQDASTVTVLPEVQYQPAEPLAEAQQGDDLFAEEAGQGDDLFGAAEPDSAQLFGSSEAAAQGEPVALEPVLSSESLSAEFDVEAEELFPAQAETEAFDLGSGEEVTSAHAAVEDSTEPLVEETDQTNLFDGPGDPQEEYFSQIVQAGPEAPDTETNIPSPDEADVPTGSQVGNLPADIFEMKMNGDQLSPDPFGAVAVEDDFFSRPTEIKSSAQEDDDQLDLPVAGRARASTKTSELFEADEADDLFAGLGATTAPDDAVAVNEGDTADSEAIGKLDVASEIFAEDHSLANDDWMGQTAPATITDEDASPSDKPGVVDGADLDLMGVPEGWVDGNGKWCWYTEDERMDVARQMVVDGTAEAREHACVLSSLKIRI